MKTVLTIISALLLTLQAYTQNDGLVASNSENSVNNEKLAASGIAGASAESDAWKHIKSGLTLDKSSDVENAIKEYGIAIQMDNSIAEAYDYRAVCYIKQAKYRKAMKDLEDAVDINENFVEAYNHLGVASYWIKNYPEAINFYSKAISLNANYATPYFNRAIVYLAMDENQLALQDLNKAKELKLDGVDPVLQQFFADKK